MNRMLKSLRVKNGDNQETLAKYLNISKTSFNYKENGKVEFTLSEARKISEKYNMSIEEIFFAS